MKNFRHEFTVGIDLGDRHCHFVVVRGVGGAEDITVCETAVVDTKEAGFAAWFEGRPPMRVVVEVGTHARWIAQMIEALGHELIVCNPRELPEIYNNAKKSDFVDAETLARIAHTDAAKLRHVREFANRDVVSLGLVRARDCLVKSRTRLVNHIRSAVKNVGGRIPGCEARRFHLYRDEIPLELVDVLGPMMDAVEAMTITIKGYKREIERVLKDAYPEEGARLQQLFGVGPTTALYFIAVIGDPNRFPSGRHLGGYLGFGQKRHQSGSREPHLKISKAGAPLLRSLLVGAARDLRSARAPDSALKDWTDRRTTKVSHPQKNRIEIGLARKLGVLMWHMLRTGQDYKPYPRGGGPAAPPKLKYVVESAA